MPKQRLKNLLKRFDFLTERDSKDCSSVLVPFARHREFFEGFEREFDFNMLMDVTAIDWDQSTPRFSVLYHFYSTLGHCYLRVRVDCPNDGSPCVPTISDLWAAADWHERETYDMFGISFSKHPNLKRILMWDGYPYYPLRKDFPLAGHETDLPAADVAEETGAKVLPAPMMGGPFVAPNAGHISNSEPRAKDQSWTERSTKPTNHQ